MEKENNKTENTYRNVAKEKWNCKTVDEVYINGKGKIRNEGALCSARMFHMVEQCAKHVIHHNTTGSAPTDRRVHTVYHLYVRGANEEHS